MEKERLRQERRDRGEDTTENEEVSGPLKLDDLIGSHLQPCQKSEADGEYEQINIGRYNFAQSELESRHPPSIQITDQDPYTGDK